MYTRFISREAELNALIHSFAGGSRLVTVVGAPGVGKTRIARQYTTLHHGETWFVDLTTARSPTDLVTQAAACLDIEVGSSTTSAMIERIGRAIRDLSMPLLVFDNFEQLTSMAPSSLMYGSG